MDEETRWRGCESAALKKGGLRVMDLAKLVRSYDLDANANWKNNRAELEVLELMAVVIEQVSCVQTSSTSTHVLQRDKPLRQPD